MANKLLKCLYIPSELLPKQLIALISWLRVREADWLLNTTVIYSLWKQSTAKQQPHAYCSLSLFRSPNAQDIDAYCSQSLFRSPNPLDITIQSFAELCRATVHFSSFKNCSWFSPLLIIQVFNIRPFSHLVTSVCFCQVCLQPN